MSFIKDIEKSPLSSKKFIGYMTASLVGKIMLGFMITNAVSPAIIMWTVTCLAFLDIGYNLSTASLDLFTRLAHIKSLAPQLPTIEPDEDKPEP